MRPQSVVGPVRFPPDAAMTTRPSRHPCRPTRHLRAALLPSVAATLASLAACGGADAPTVVKPPPPPYAKTVEVSGPTTMLADGVIELAALVRDQHGAEMPSAAVTWLVIPEPTYVTVRPVADRRVTLEPSADGRRLTVRGRTVGLVQLEAKAGTGWQSAGAVDTVTVVLGAPPSHLTTAIRVNPGTPDALRLAAEEAFARWKQVLLEDLPTSSPVRRCDEHPDTPPTWTIRGVDLYLETRAFGPDGPVAAAIQCNAHPDGRAAAMKVQFNVDNIRYSPWIAAGPGTNDRRLLVEVMTHEIGHGLGLGSGRAWTSRRVQVGGQWYFTGSKAVLAARAMGVIDASAPGVPLTSDGAHWLLSGELMAQAGGGALSELTLAALEDLGYRVWARGADPYWRPGT